MIKPIAVPGERYEAVVPGARDMITVEFPMVETRERYRVGDTRYTCHFKGNTLVDISPRDNRSTVYPIYWIDHYKRDEVPMKKVTRAL